MQGISLKEEGKDISREEREAVKRLEPFVSGERRNHGKSDRKFFGVC